MDKITSEDQLNRAIADNPSFIVMFTAVWSSVGNTTKKNFERIGAKYPTLYQAWVSTDDNPELAEKWGFTAIPAVVGYKDGNKVDSYVGPMYLDEQVEGFIRKVL